MDFSQLHALCVSRSKCAFFIIKQNCRSCRWVGGCSLGCGSVAGWEGVWVIDRCVLVFQAMSLLALSLRLFSICLSAHVLCFRGRCSRSLLAGCRSGSLLDGALVTFYIRMGATHVLSWSERYSDSHVAGCYEGYLPSGALLTPSAAGVPYSRSLPAGALLRFSAGHSDKLVMLRRFDSRNIL